MTSHAPKVGIVGLGTSVPPHVVSSARAREFAREAFAGHHDRLARLLGVFDHPAMAQRHVARPLEWYSQSHSLAARNSAYIETATELLVDASGKALADAQLDPSEVAAVIVVTSTGIATPSLDGEVIQRLNLPRSAQRLPLWGLGCGGGGAGLARARLLAMALQRPILVAAVELCSLTFVAGDHSSANVVATSLFGDGAAAMIVGPTTHPSGRAYPWALEILGSHSQLYDDTRSLMGWDLSDDGLRVRFGTRIPKFVRDHSGDFVDATCAQLGLARDQLSDIVLHPGGPKVLSAYADSLGVPESTLDDAWQVLARYGNMSSPTVLFVLEQYRQRRLPAGRLGLIMAVGPGFAAEATVFRTL